MAKPGFLNILAPLALGAAGLAAPELLGAILPAEAAAGGGAATLADTVGGLGAADFLGSTAGEGVLAGATSAATPLASTALAGLSDSAISGLPDAVSGLGAAAGAVPNLAGEAGNLLAATPATQTTTPLAATSPLVTGPDVSGISAPTAASPAGGGLFSPGPAPAGVRAPDFTGGLPGPPAGANVNVFATEPVGAPAQIAPSTITPGGPGLAAADYPALSPAAESAVTSGAATAGETAGNPFAVSPLVGDAEGGFGGTVGNFAGKAGEWALNHPGALLTGGLFGSQLLKGNPPFPAETSVGNLGAAAQGTAAQLTSPLNTGILPPGAQQEVDASTNAAIAQTKSAYGNLGLTGSTMEADKISQIKQNASAQQFAIANDLLKSGASFSSIAGNDYNAVLNAQMQRDEQYRNALYGFARSLAGSGYSPPAYAAAAGG